MQRMVLYLAVAGAGAVGSILRLLVSTFCRKHFGAGFPFGTFIINLSGSFFLGWFIEYARLRLDLSDTLKIAIAVGLVGAYTTFSTFIFESVELYLKDGAAIKAALNIFGSLILGLAAVILGMRLAAR